ncbi:MAG TPA: DUF4105 domain-containing protein [Ferruginibacter sp.]|jgi:hypothetical protein|nr:DUF4105 domain-containing protein [Ferruginibacter sp.]
MKNRKRYTFLITHFLLLIIYMGMPAITKAQDSSHIRISLLTCTPGEELYSTFGHSAVRVTDSLSKTDIVFSYGNFPSYEDGFYLKFIRGKLLYYIDYEDFQDFVNDYQTDDRGITEQVLNLTALEKINIDEALLENIKPENKFYKYDFFFDNCTTRNRDIIINNDTAHIFFTPAMPAGTTFRQAIHLYLDRNNKAWSKLGIDLMLGKPCDAVMTTAQSQFLPDNLMVTFDSCKSSTPLVLSKKDLYPYTAIQSSFSLFTPNFIFWTLLLIIIVLSFSPAAFARNFLLGFDGMLFFLTGFFGLVFIFMWTCTDHTLCQDNFNLLWAWPTHIIMALFVRSKNELVKKYFGLTAIALALLLAVWFFLPQQMNNALLPVILLLIYRSTARCITPTNTL